MSTLHLHQTTTATPEQFLAALTDFGPDRSTIFPNSQDQHLQVHSRTAADVTEGTGGGVGTAALRLVRPDPHRDHRHRLQRVGRPIRLPLHPHRPPRRPHRHRRGRDGDGKNLKGRIIGFGLGTAIGKHTFETA